MRTMLLLIAWLKRRPLIVFRYVEIAGVSIDYYAMPFCHDCPRCGRSWWFTPIDDAISDPPMPWYHLDALRTGIAWAPVNRAASRLARALPFPGEKREGRP